MARQLQDALDIEQEENQRELTERIRRQQQRENDEYTENQIRLDKRHEKDKKTHFYKI